MEAEASGEIPFAIRFNDSLRTEVFSPPVFAAMCSPNLTVAITRLSTYKSLIAPMTITVIEGDETVTFSPEWFGADRSPPGRPPPCAAPRPRTCPCTPA